MRLWSIHPQYLDSKGLVALWREGLLAQNVLLGKTKAYQNHPQLERFKNHSEPRKAISAYLVSVYDEAVRRGYHFMKNKIVRLPRGELQPIRVARGQIHYEFQHLRKKLRQRDSEMYRYTNTVKRVKLHPLFKSVKGGTAHWEKMQ